jgi:choline dehydrogenase-like flavoprotein
MKYTSNMLLDPAALDASKALQADLAIIGAGAAGITIAREFVGSSVSVLLIEGGGFEGTSRSQELYDAEMVTRYRQSRSDDRYPLTSRLRFFGGTTNHWSGWCRPLERLDFEERAWVEHSGWPFGIDELRPWYQSAMPLLDIAGWESLEGRPKGPDMQRVLELPGAKLETRTFHFSKPTRFGRKYRRELLDADNVRLLNECNLLRLHAGQNGQRIERASMRLEDGPELELRARAFVLACGGIENARILLLSDAEQGRGLGNRYDLVGRYFQEHPHDSRAGQLVFAEEQEPAVLSNYYIKRPRVPGGRMKRMNLWQPSERAQQEESLLNASIQIRDPEQVELDAMGEGVSALAGHIAAWAKRDSSAPRRAMIWTRCEHAPNPESRITLGDERDRLGLRKARVDWRLTELEARTIRRCWELFAQAMGEGLVGRARVTVDPAKPFRTTWGGAHHMGTTRMHAGSRQGVVNADCRVHGLANLYVAGSSVFPTSGVANPTFTIVALALRLAKHLKAALG